MASPEHHNENEQFFTQFTSPNQLFQLFDSLPDVYCYLKDLESRYMRASIGVCRVIGVENDSEIIGKTDFDFFPPAVAAQYQDEDRRVIEAKTPLLNQIWLVPGSKGVPRIYLCDKIPLFQDDAKLIGIAGVKRPYEQSQDSNRGFGRLIAIIDYVTKNYATPITVGELAEVAEFSTSHLNREFSSRFGITPTKYIREVRVGVARRMLETSNFSMAEVAGKCGFYDQAHFTRQFKKSTGLTPLSYSKRFRE